MKKTIFAFLFLTLVAHISYAQFLQGVGIFIAETSSRDGYHNLYPRDISNDPTFKHSRPPQHRGAEYESWGIGIFADLLNSEKWRWRTEIEYANKGSIENELLDPVTNAQRVGVNAYQKIQWNNFLKRYIDLGIRFPTYAMLGARLEYTMANSPGAYTYISGAFLKFMASADAGLGIEFPLRKGFSLFVEEHYNLDGFSKYVADPHIGVWGRTWETRVGLIYRWKRGIGAYDIDCNAPRYHGR